ncbi:hypothetical protein G6F43_003558 [Rhizopus delemar]|nr:hypothetical protein G6F43_003558 [Rhizopus delemar]
MPTVYIIIYSVYHHIYTLSKSIKKGLEEQGVTVKLYQVPETLTDEILQKLHAPPKPDIPVITVDALTEADAFIFGIPTRFGTLPAQMKSFLDATGSHWATGALAGKFVGTFFSSASQHGGQETTAFTLLTYFAHHGLNYVPLGFANAHLFDNSEVVGGSAYGAGTIANGDGSRLPTEKELDIAQTQGVNFANLLNAYHRGLTPDTSGTKSTHKEIKTSDAPTADAAAPPAPVESTGEPTAATTAITDAGDHQAEPTAERSAEATEKKASAVKAKKEEKKSKCFCM